MKFWNSTEFSENATSGVQRSDIWFWCFAKTYLLICSISNISLFYDSLARERSPAKLFKLHFPLTAVKNPEGDPAGVQVIGDDY